MLAKSRVPVALPPSQLPPLFFWGNQPGGKGGIGGIYDSCQPLLVLVPLNRSWTHSRVVGGAKQARQA